MRLVHGVLSFLAILLIHAGGPFWTSVLMRDIRGLSLALLDICLKILQSYLQLWPNEILKLLAEMWDDVMDASTRTCKALTAHGAQHLVLIDSISARRAPTAGRVKEAEQMEKAEWIAYRDRISTVAKMGVEEYGLTVGIHAHAGGFMDFEPELERLLSEIDENILKICFDTGHHSYAGFDPLSFLDRYLSRISYIHFKDINPVVKAHVINNRTDFYKACGQGIFCNLGQGDVNFPEIRKRLIEKNFDGWCTVEQDCDPSMKGTSFKDALANRKYLQSIGF
jgi:inosose dehydratase